MEEKKEDSIKVNLKHKYSFGKSVTVQDITLADELQIEKKMLANNGAGEKLYTIMLACGLSEEEASTLRRSDTVEIVEAMSSF